MKLLSSSKILISALFIVGLFFFFRNLRFFDYLKFPEDQLQELIFQQKKSEGDECVVFFYKDKKGENYVLKQTKKDDPRPLVASYVASRIGGEIGIPVPKAYIVASDKKIGGKILERPALLEELAMGQPCSEEDEEFRIQQRSRSISTEAEMDQRYGKIPEKRKGLNRRVIASMARHRGLPKLVAFDTFVNNGDRSPPNLFYDQETNRYTGIDQGASFEDKNLAFLAINQLKKAGDNLTPEEKEALEAYKQTLEELYKRFPPEKIIKMLDEVMSQMGLSKNSPGVKDSYEGWSKSIHQNNANIRSLIDLLKDME